MGMEPGERGLLLAPSRSTGRSVSPRRKQGGSGNLNETSNQKNRSRNRSLGPRASGHATLLGSLDSVPPATNTRAERRNSNGHKHKTNYGEETRSSDKSKSQVQPNIIFRRKSLSRTDSGDKSTKENDISALQKHASGDPALEASRALEKQEKEIKVLNTMVQTLAKKLKKRDTQLQMTQDRLSKTSETEVKLAHAEDRVIELVSENHKLERQLQSLRAELAAAATNNEAAAASLQKANAANEARADAANNRSKSISNAVEESDPLGEGSVSSQLYMMKVERDAAIKKAGVLAVQLADLRAENDDMRDKLTSLDSLDGGVDEPPPSSFSRTRGEDQSMPYTSSHPPTLPPEPTTPCSSGTNYLSSVSERAWKTRGVSLRNLWQ
jgi:hypothetical protein